MRTTIAIPLHQSQRWSSVVAGNLERLSPVAHLLVSDATGDDDTLDQLRARYGHLAGVTWLGPRDTRLGWVAHCNDLLARSTTEYFMWLPHDDEVDSSWVTRGEEALDRNPAAILALGEMRSLEPGGRSAASRYVARLHRPFAAAERGHRLEEALRTCLTGDSSLLGAAFRGIVRRGRSAPLPDTGAEGAWSDMFWAIRLLSRGPFTDIAAVYWKRWYDDSTHSRWRPLRSWDELRTRHLPEALGEMTPGERQRALTEAWTSEVEALRGIAEATRLAKEHSRSWRLTAPLRGLSAVFRRLRDVSR